MKKRKLSGREAAVAKVERVLGCWITSYSILETAARPRMVFVFDEGSGLHTLQTAMLFSSGKWTLVRKDWASEGFSGILGGKYNTSVNTYVRAARELGLLTNQDVSHCPAHVQTHARRHRSARSSDSCR